MIRRFLAREEQRLLEEFNAPDLRTLLLRAIFWAYVTIITTTVLLGLVAIGNMFGLEWMWAAAVIIILLCIRLTRRAPLYSESAPFLLGSEQTALPPPGKSALPPPSRRALTPTVRSGTGREALPPR
jgi:hypothetical protein